MARMEDGSATMFLTDMDRQGIRLERNMEAMDRCFTGGHGVLLLENLRVPAADVLGEVGKGFRYAQVRLAPARLIHCMRWLGQARRAHDLAVDYARKRQAFGRPLAEHEGVGFMLADNGSVMAKHERVPPATCGRSQRSFWPGLATSSMRWMFPSSGAWMFIAVGPSQE